MGIGSEDIDANEIEAETSQASEQSADSEYQFDPGSESESESLRKKRRKRDPFRDQLPVHSSAAAIQKRQLASSADLRRIKKAGVKHEGRRVVTDDVNKLKSLSIEPLIEDADRINHYIEPVRIEYYIPKDSRFVVETRYLYIPLIDPVPRSDPDDAILRDHIENNEFFDIILIMNDYPQYITSIIESYHQTLSMYESLSKKIDEAEENPEAYRSAFYLCEILAEYEPTLAALEYFGEFMVWNLNWLVRRMNALDVKFSASDKTISYFIKLRNMFWEENDFPYEERFEILAALFYDQAFPNRGLSVQEEDYFYDIFDKKSVR